MNKFFTYIKNILHNKKSGWDEESLKLIVGHLTSLEYPPIFCDCGISIEGMIIYNKPIIENNHKMAKLECGSCSVVAYMNYSTIENSYKEDITKYYNENYYRISFDQDENNMFKDDEKCVIIDFGKWKDKKGKI